MRFSMVCPRVVAVLALLPAVPHAPVVQAATVTVTDLGDTLAPGQLRSLMNAAAPGDTIVIPAGTITLAGPAGEMLNAGGDLNISKDLTIRGQGPGVTILDGGGIDRVFQVDGGVTAAISGMTIRNGNAGTATGGGVLNGGTLRLANSAVSGNTGLFGGGVDAVGGSTTLTDVSVTGNTAARDGGGIRAVAPASLVNVTVSGNTAARDGGGIVSTGTFALTGSTVSANAGRLAGGILNRGTLTVVNTTIAGNTSDDGGGGIRNEGTATLASSTISANAGPTGGGIENNGALALVNVTVSDNTASSEGAGLYNASSGSATLTNVTLAANSGLFSGALRNVAGGSVAVRNTIVQRGQSGANCSGPITSQGHNLSSDDSCLSSFGSPGDLNAMGSLIGPLQDNGGPTRTHALEAGGGSPAVDGGDGAGCPPIDQRGFVRPVDGDGNASALCDIGAFELGPAIDTAAAASVLPLGRAVQVGTSATVFATVINAGPVLATGCRPAPITPLPAAFTYQTTDPSSNALTGTAGTPADIPAGQTQSFVLAFTPAGPIAPVDVLLSFACANAAPAPTLLGVSTLLLSASAGPVPDPVALADTPAHNGILTLASAGAFAVATVNVGASAQITVSADTADAALPLALLLCRTDPATAACLSAPAPSVTTQMDAGATATFSIFADAAPPIPFDPAANRIFVRFRDLGGVIRGATSVAVCSAPLCP